MKKIVLSDKQKTIIEDLYAEKVVTENKLNEVKNKISMVVSLIFDNEHEDVPDEVIYEDGVIKYKTEQ